MNSDSRPSSEDGMPIRLVKVGGSLLTWPKLPVALRGWLDDQPPARNVLLCGGGSLADAIRQADRTFALGEETSHALCLEVLGVTAQLLAALLGAAAIAPTSEELRMRLCELRYGPMVLDPRRLLSAGEADCPGARLPHNWDVTSDSIAARLAQVIGAAELVLLKSADPPPAATHGDLAASGYVDRHFRFAAAGVRGLRLVNLRRALHG